STPDTKFRIDLFANQATGPSGFGQGERLLGAVTVTTDSHGEASFSFVANRALAAGSTVTATATDVVTGDTSEFSAAQPVSVPGGDGSAALHGHRKVSAAELNRFLSRFGPFLKM